ncbi:MAG: segregation/condensation protein A [Coriobacteriia bacterium]|nr:segregation/condensation protein A [Coriobacteriia bacterium]
MAYRVRTESFEGPFDLLLYLVNRQRIDIGSVNISEIASQYLDEVERMKRLDLDVASDFLVVAATLLEIKAASLVDAEADELDEELADIDADDAREMLLSQLLQYKQYKNAAAAFDTMMFEASKRHVRSFGPPPEFMNLMPDYLAGMTLEDLARHYVECYMRRDTFLLESEHIASKPIPLEGYLRSLHKRISSQKSFRFSEIVPSGASAEIVVVTFLAILELLKRNMVTVRQRGVFGDIVVKYIEGSGSLAESGPIEEYGEVG